MKSHSIRTKIIATITTICILVFSFIILYLHFFARPANEKNVLFLIRQNVETKAQEVNQWIEKRIVEYRTLAVIPAIKSMDTRLITPIIEQVTNSYRLNDQTMETFSFIGKNGFCWINAQATENLIRYDDYMEIYANDDEFLIGQPVVNNDNRRVVVFYYAINGYTGKKESLIASAVPLFRIEEIVNTLQLYGSKSWIMDTNHQVITSNADYIDSRYIDLASLHQLDLNQFNDSTILDVDSVKGKAKLIISPISSYNDWKLMTLVSEDAINKSINNIMQGALFVLVLLLFLILLLGKYLSNAILQPIQTLQQCMTKAQQGNLNAYYPINSSHDEIYELGSAYNQMIDDLALSIDQIYKEQQKLRNAELKTLQEQIKPHFLYNTLDNIRWMAKKQGADNVVQAITDLSTFFRLSLSNGQEYVTLAQEFKHTKSYLDIQKMRYGDKFSYLIELDPSIEQLMITKIVLQPIVENAINHGIKNSTKNGTIQISGQLVNDNVILSIEDDGIGMSKDKINEIKNGMKEESTGHYGLKNIYQRLNTYCKHGFDFTIESFVGIGTKVTLTLSRKDMEKDV